MSQPSPTDVFLAGGLGLVAGLGQNCVCSLPHLPSMSCFSQEKEIALLEV